MGKEQSLAASPARLRAAKGFTLVELVVTVAILGVLLTMAVPLFSDAILSSRLSSYGNRLVGSIYTARSESMKRNKNVTLCASSNGTSCASSGGWQQGWIVIDLTTNEVIERQQPLADGYSLTDSGGHHLARFPSTGVGIAPMTTLTFKICRLLPDPGRQERRVSVSATGKPSIERTEDGTCP